MPGSMIDLVTGSEVISAPHTERLGEGGPRALMETRQHPGSLALLLNEEEVQVASTQDFIRSPERERGPVTETWLMHYYADLTWPGSTRHASGERNPELLLQQHWQIFYVNV